MSEQFYVFTTRQLGLAAYIHMNGAEVVRKSKKSGYKLRSTKPLHEWSVEYANSREKRHDQTLIGLRDMPSED